MVRSYLSPSFSSFVGRPSGPTAFAFVIAFIAVAIPFSVGSIPRALATGCCGSLFGMSGSNMPDFAFSSERKYAPTSPRSPSFLGWDHQFSGPHDGCGECGFLVVHTAVSSRVCPEVPSTRCGHLLSKLEVSHQAPTIHRWSSWGPQPAISSKMAEAWRVRTQCCGLKWEGRGAGGAS